MFYNSALYHRIPVHVPHQEKQRLSCTLLMWWLFLWVTCLMFQLWSCICQHSEFTHLSNLREKIFLFMCLAEAKSKFIQNLSLNCLNMFFSWHGIRSHDHLPFFLSAPPGYKPNLSHALILFGFDYYYYLHICVYMYVFNEQIFKIHFHLFFSCDCFYFLAPYLLVHELVWS